MINLNKTCLIITGTISPDRNIFALNLNDPEERLKQYISSIEYYIKESNLKKIIFCDNSNYNSGEIALLKSVAANYNKEFEYLFFAGNKDAVLSKGKGYGEGEIIEYVLKNSLIISDCNCFIKVTGRIKIRNINRILYFSKNTINYFDIVSLSKNLCDTRFYIVSKDDYIKYFLNAYKNVNDESGHWIEHEFKEILNRKDIKYECFMFLPHVDGISGSSGNKYEYSKYLSIKYSIKLLLIKIHLFDFFKKINDFIKKK